MAAGFIEDNGGWKDDQIRSIVDLYKYTDQNDCCRALVGAWSYVHIQVASSQVWTVHHGLKTDDVVVFGFDAEILGHDMLDWSNVHIIDHNTLQVVWPTPRTGRVVIISTGTRPNPNLELFLQFIDAYPDFYTEYVYDADDYIVSKTHWDNQTKTVKLFTITYAFVDGYLMVKRVKHEINSQVLVITNTWDTMRGTLTNVARRLEMA